jgi:ornithine cyclodeaminase
MAGATLAALHEVLEISEVRVTSKRAESRQAFAARMGTELGLAVVPAESVDEAIGGADVIVTATTANAPLVRARAVKAGALILSMGTHQELDADVFRCVSKIVPDDREKCKIWGDLAVALDAGALTEEDLYAELGQVVSGQRPARERDDEIILAVPQGMISQDVALAHFIYRRALAGGGGRWMGLS